VPFTPAQDGLPARTPPIIRDTEHDQTQSKQDKQRDKPKQPGSARADEQPGSSGASVGQQVEETVGTLPLGAQVGETLPLGAVTDLVDTTLEDVDETVDDVTGLLP
jgi:hypothetical protein